MLRNLFHSVPPSLIILHPSHSEKQQQTCLLILQHLLPSIPSTGFKFSLPFEQKGSQTTTNDSKEESTTEATGNESQDATKVDATPEESKPINLQNGEEDEVALFSQKAKLMTFNAETKSYDSRGVGEMKLLKKKDDPSKVRLLCRSDGMGNVLLNATVVDSFKYEPLAPGNDNLIKAPTVAADETCNLYRQV